MFDDARSKRFAGQGARNAATHSPCHRPTKNYSPSLAQSMDGKEQSKLVKTATVRNTAPCFDIPSQTIAAPRGLRSIATINASLLLHGGELRAWHFGGLYTKWSTRQRRSCRRHAKRPKAWDRRVAEKRRACPLARQSSRLRSSSGGT